MARTKWAVIIEEPETIRLAQMMDVFGNKPKTKLFNSDIAANKWASQRFSCWSTIAFTPTEYRYAGGAIGTMLMVDLQLSVFARKRWGL